MAQTTPTPTPSTQTVPNHPVPPSTRSATTRLSSGSGTSPLASITSLPSISSSISANGTFNSTATTSTAIFAWDCNSSGAASKASLYENFSGCTYAQSSTPTARPSNGTNATISGGTPVPTNNAGVRVATGVEFGSIGALGLVLVTMMGWL
ncbi:hypothetical protein P280DRAFT_521604 [Massarina eburnea CBS 473.64]|uniref:Uncharacterized protein n=1 Tax=Massarina eburnea CBS 473.64 TaxID=1395130 RepID=A0A6A6RS53_9PLEO|nr:hypothetical protein P280DRAFT_521604 [Massarina eburnea CBS 473.64]